MRTSDAIDALSAAMAAAQGEMKPAVKDATNPHFKSKYADLASVFEAIRAPFAKHGLSVWQELDNADNGVKVTTRLVHKSGQWVEFGPLSVPAFKQDAQGLGSAATYARRYGLAAALGVCADEDDDGNKAAEKPPGYVEPDRVKNAPGVSKARAWVSEFVRDAMACESGDQFAELCTGTRTQFIRICSVYPNLWSGPDGSGLRGETIRIGTIMEQRPFCDGFIASVEKAAAETNQPQAAE